MAVELRHLRYFVAVAEELHFGRAAARLHIVQPALSKQIVALERELGVRLFDRTKRSVTITKAGEAFYTEASAVLRSVDHGAEVARLTAVGQLGSLAVGFIGSAMWSILPQVLTEHRQRFPGVRFRLSELPSALQTKQIRNRELDVGFIRPSVRDDVLVYRTVFSEELVVGLPETHPCAALDEIELSDLQDETFVLVARETGPGFYDHSLMICHAAGFRPTTVEVGESASAVYGMVAAGLGVTFAPESDLSVPWPGVVFRPLADATEPIGLAAVYHRDDRSPALEAFMQTIDDVASQRARDVASKNGGGGATSTRSTRGSRRARG